MSATVKLPAADGTEMSVYTAQPTRVEAAWRGHEQSGPPRPAVEARPPSDQRERPKQKVAKPPASGQAPGVMVFQEAFGVNTHIRDVANRLAALGYLAAAPELYHRTAPGFEGDYTNFNTATPHMRALTTEGLDDDIRATHSWLTEQGCERIVAVGFCMGGRVAARAAAAVPLAAAASFYGGGLNTLEDLVPRVGAPLLLVWGDRDTHIPLEVRTGFANALRAHKKSFVECTFSDAGHGFFCDQRASYHAPSAHLAWSLLTAFLAEPAG